MPSLVIFLLVIIAVTIPQNVYAGVTVPDIDIAKLLDLVQQQANRQHSSDSTSDSSDSDDSDSSDYSNYVRNGKAGESDIVDLIRQVIKSRSDKVGHDHKNKEKPRNVARLKDEKSNNKIEHPRNDEIAQVLNQLLGNTIRKPEVKYHPSNKATKKRIAPNRLLWDVRDSNADSNGLEEYSKIFVVLNPQSVQKTKNAKSAVNQLISKILALSSPSSNRISARAPKPIRYKGFNLKDHTARRRGSREMYAPDDDLDDRPTKRGRNSGGNNGGHTAIPYIRHRGENIYEKEN